jgi:hypothetical protein
MEARRAFKALNLRRPVQMRGRDGCLVKRIDKILPGFSDGANATGLKSSLSRINLPTGRRHHPEQCHEHGSLEPEF